MLDCMRLMDLLLVLLFEGRKAISKNMTIANSVGITSAAAVAAAHVFPRIRRIESSGDKSYRQLIDCIRSKDCEALIEAVDSSGEWFRLYVPFTSICETFKFNDLSLG